MEESDALGPTDPQKPHCNPQHRLLDGWESLRWRMRKGKCNAEGPGRLDLGPCRIRSPWLARQIRHKSLNLAALRWFNLSKMSPEASALGALGPLTPPPPCS